MSVEPADIQASRAQKYSTCSSPGRAERAVLAQTIPVQHTCQLRTDTSQLLGSLKEPETPGFGHVSYAGIPEAFMQCR